MVTKKVLQKKATEPVQRSLNVKGLSRTRRADPVTDRIAVLQRSIGNRAVEGLFRSSILQAKFKIGRSNDIYEQEADRVAGQVMQMPESTIQMKPG